MFTVRDHRHDHPELIDKYTGRSLFQIPEDNGRRLPLHRIDFLRLAVVDVELQSEFEYQ